MKGQNYRLGYRTDIEGLRAIAILLVVAVHAGVPWLHGGFVGVDVFFVLSGFLITGLLVQEVSNTGQLRFIEFYARRLRRLLPALLTMLLVVFVPAAVLLAPAEQQEQSSAAAMAVLWLSNIHFAFAKLGYFEPGTETNLFLHTWSLGVEEQFYLIWPVLLVWLIGRDGERGMARLKIGMLVVAVVSLLACVVLTYKAPQLAFYMMPLRAWQFAAGALIWLYFKAPGAGMVAVWKGNHTTMLRAAGWIGMALIAFAGVSFSANMVYPGAYALLPTVGAVCVVAAGCTAAPLSGVSRALSWRPLQWIGHVSYSWYLWHWPVLLLGLALTGSDAPVYRVVWVLLSLILASASYVCIESPARRQRQWLVHPRIAVFCTLALMLVANNLCLRWHAYASEQMQSPVLQRYARAYADAPVIYRMGCDDFFHNDRVHICQFGQADATHTALLMGDSHAAQWFPAVAEVFDRPGWRVLVLIKGSCPMVNQSFFLALIGQEYTVCSSWREQALARVATIKPELVLLSTDSTYEFTKLQWIDGTAKVLSVLSPVAGHIYVLRDTPHLPFDGPDCLAERAEHADLPDWLRLRHSCSISSSDSHADQVSGWLGQATEHFANVSMLDMNELVCPDRTCSAEQEGIVVFRDSQHLTASFAASLGSSLANKLGVNSKSPTDMGVQVQASPGSPVSSH